MEKFECTLRVTGLPREVRAGQRIVIEAEVTSSNQEVSGVYISVPMAGMMEQFKKVEDKYILRTDVPYGGGGGVYSVSIYAKNADNARSEPVMIQVRAS